MPPAVQGRRPAADHDDVVGAGQVAKAILERRDVPALDEVAGGQRVTDRGQVVLLDQGDRESDHASRPVVLGRAEDALLQVDLRLEAEQVARLARPTGTRISTST